MKLKWCDDCSWSTSTIPLIRGVVVSVWVDARAGTWSWRIGWTAMSSGGTGFACIDDAKREAEKAAGRLVGAIKRKRLGVKQPTRERSPTHRRRRS